MDYIVTLARENPFIAFTLCTVVTGIWASWASKHL